MENEIIKTLKNPKKLLGRINHRYPRLFSWMDDETCIKFWYKYYFHRDLNLENPQTFNEKLQWLKLNDRNPAYTSMVDKYEAKKYVANVIGDEYIIPTLGVWDKFDDIDFDSLPEQFVLKCTHDSGGLVICSDKSKFDKAAARRKINHSMRRNYYWVGREWPYKNVKPRIIAEKYMVDESGYELKDYKLFCFDGFAKAMFIASDRQKEGEETKFDFFDMNFVHLPFTNGHPNSKNVIKRPESFEKMKALAEKLSVGIPHVRVDFYDINGQVYFGELTFAHWSGYVPFDPESWDKQFGEWIKLPEKLGGLLIADRGFILWLHSETSKEKSQNELNDYKLWCFNGEPKMTLVCTDRFSSQGLHEDFFDMEWNHLPIRRPNYSNARGSIPEPNNYKLMQDLARIISRNLPFARVDFYEINNQVFFGEITFFPALGFRAFEPESIDEQFGKWLKLPEIIA